MQRRWRLSLSVLGGALVLIIPMLASMFVFLSRLDTSTNILALRASQNAAAIVEIKDDLKYLSRCSEPPIPDPRR